MSFISSSFDSDELRSVESRSNARNTELDSSYRYTAESEDSSPGTMTKLASYPEISHEQYTGSMIDSPSPSQHFSHSISSHLHFSAAVPRSDDVAYFDFAPSSLNALYLSPVDASTSARKQFPTRLRLGYSDSEMYLPGTSSLSSIHAWSPTDTCQFFEHPYPQREIKLDSSDELTASDTTYRNRLSFLPPSTLPTKTDFKKPTLACLFCRGRKIACRPAVEGDDQTCNQCVKRGIKCEYPTESRRGQHKRKAKGFREHDVGQV